MKKTVLLCLFSILISACDSFRPILILQDHGVRTIKVEKGYCTHCGTNSFSVYLRESPIQETFWRFDCYTHTNKQHLNPFRQEKQVRQIKGKKIQRIQYYEAIHDTTGLKPEIEFSKEDSIVLFQILPLLKEEPCLQKTSLDAIKGFRFIEEKPAGWKSRYRKIKIK